MAWISPDEDGIVGVEEVENIHEDIVWSKEMFTYDNFISCSNFDPLLGLVKKTITLREFHGCILTAMFADGIFAGTYSDMIRNLFVIGSISICKNNNISNVEVDDVIGIILSSSSISNSDISDKITQRIESINKVIDINDSGKVFEILEKHSKSKFVRKCYVLFCEKEPPVFNVSINVSENTLVKCKSLLKRKLTISELNVKRLIGNESHSVWLPKDCMILVSNIGLKLYKTSNPSEIIRLCIIQGLYIISNLIVSGAMKYDELIANIALKRLESLYINTIRHKHK